VGLAFPSIRQPALSAVPPSQPAGRHVPGRDSSVPFTHLTQDEIKPATNAAVSCGCREEFPPKTIASTGCGVGWGRGRSQAGL